VVMVEVAMETDWSGVIPAGEGHEQGNNFKNSYY
jgi:hypothetical protein